MQPRLQAFNGSANVKRILASSTSMTARNSLVILDSLFLVNPVSLLMRGSVQIRKLVENSENPYLRNSILPLSLHLGVFIFCMLFALAIACY